VPGRKLFKNSQQISVAGGEAHSIWGCWQFPHSAQSFDGNISLSPGLILTDEQDGWAAEIMES